MSGATREQATLTEREWRYLCSAIRVQTQIHLTHADKVKADHPEWATRLDEEQAVLLAVGKKLIAATERRMLWIGEAGK